MSKNSNELNNQFFFLGVEGGGSYESFENVLRLLEIRLQLMCIFDSLRMALMETNIVLKNAFFKFC